MRDPYDSLAVPRSATAADIKKSFRELAKRLHPDANNNDPKAAALFAELNAAHELLGDDEKRRAFDHGEIDAEGKPIRRAIADRSKPSMSHIATSLMVVMVMLFITATLIMRGVSPDKNNNAISQGGDGVLAAIEAKEEQPPATQLEQPAATVQSAPRLILRQSVSHPAAGNSVPLGIQVSGQGDRLALEISGLPSGMKISSGRELGRGGWRIVAADAGNATIQPPPGFSGPIDLAVELQLLDNTVVDRGSLHFEWPQKPAAAAERIESVDASLAAENSANKALPTPPQTDQKAVQDASGSLPNHEPIDLLIRKSERLVAAGDVEAARSMLQPAAEGHDARAALALGATYDPIMLAIFRARSAVADSSLALDWYKKAQQFGSREAEQRLRSLGNALMNPKRRIVHAPVSVSHAAVPHMVAPRAATRPPYSNGVAFVAGDRIGLAADPSIRGQLARDDANRRLPLGVSY